MENNPSSLMVSEDQHGYLFKLLLLGGAGVGKSCLLERFVDGSHRESYVNTIGVDFKTKTIKLDDRIIKLQIWDTGEYLWRSINSVFD